MKYFLTASLFAILFSVTPALQADEEHPPLPPDTATFKALKSLVGTWTGMEAGKDKPVTVNYKITAGGSAVEETIFTGSPHEMVTLYTQDGKDIVMTHYCMLGNQPRLRTTKNSSSRKQVYEFVDGTGMKSRQDPHMGGLILHLKGKNKLVQEWTMFEGGKAGKQTLITLNRQR